MVVWRMPQQAAGTVAPEVTVILARAACAGMAPVARDYQLTRSSPRMEPRPPRPRSPRPFETPGSPETAGIGERLYPAPGEPLYYPGAEPYVPGAAAEGPLLPRRQRRQRGVLRGIAAVVVAIALIAALGWLFRDAVRGLVVPEPPTPTVAALVPGPATPAAPQSAALPNALATVTPTAAPVATATPRPGAAGQTGEDQDADPDALDGEPALVTEPDRDISAQTMPLLDFLPSQAEMPAGLILADEAERSKAEVLSALGGTEEAAQLLEDWGWSGNAYRDFTADGISVPPGGSTFLNVSVHRFASSEAAANALVVFSDEVILSQGLQPVEAPAIGESARLLVGESDPAALAVLYAQQGPIMYRIGGSAPLGTGDPTLDVLAVAGEIIPGQAGDA
jgi:hypothetical protein